MKYGFAMGRPGRGARWAVVALALVTSAVPSLAGRQSAIPSSVDPGYVRQLDAATEIVNAPFPGLLVIPPGRRHTPDATYGGMYDATCAVYIGEKAAGSQAVAQYDRRFIVHVPTSDSLPLAKQVGKMLLLLLGEVRQRLHLDHPVAHPTIDVWLTARPRAGGGADIAGEQRGNQIWVFDIASDRTPVEWAREVSHEYGHFILPGVAGFTEPEEWANGVLGERLFLRWINLDLQSNRIAADDLPLGTPQSIADYVARQSDALIRNIATEGFDERRLSRHDSAGMDYYTGLALYIDAVYGSKMLLSAMSNTSAQESGIVHAADFYHGFKMALQNAAEIALRPPAVADEGVLGTFRAYLPPGRFALSSQEWRFASDHPGLVRAGARALRVKAGVWVSVQPGSGEASAAGEPILRLTRSGG